MGKSLFSDIYKSFLLSVTSSTAFRQGFNFKFAFKFRTFGYKIAFHLLSGFGNSFEVSFCWISCMTIFLCYSVVRISSRKEIEKYVLIESQ